MNGVKPIDVMQSVKRMTSSNVACGHTQTNALPVRYLVFESGFASGASQFPQENPVGF